MIGVGDGMPDAAILLLPVALVAALAALALLVFRRTGVIAARSREANTARQLVTGFVARVDAVLGPIIERVDTVRRRTADASAIADDLEAAQDAVAGLTDEARQLSVPLGLVDVRGAIVGELERAGRALSMVEHGCGILTAARLRGRELEGQTAIKRGYLNLLHSREAIVRHGGRAASWRSPAEVRRDLRRVSS